MTSWEAPELHSDLGVLADPQRFNEPLRVEGLDPERLRALLRSMLTIRLAEEKIAALVVEGATHTPCHLGIGQEAVAVGIAEHLRSTDRVFGGHRSHSQYLALGGDVYRLIAEVLGRVDGASRGMGGSMHLLGRDVGFHGSVPLVGATIPIAVGAALAAKMDGKGAVAVAFFGDGACEEGVFHESLNFAAVHKLPVLFVVENNLFSSHLDLQFRQPSDSMARFGAAHRVASKVVDGNDVLAVSQGAAALIKGARTGEGPGLLEAVTFRFRGHVGPNEDIDVGVHRKMEDVRAWRARCPIVRLGAALAAADVLTVEGQAALREELVRTIDEHTECARRAPHPEPAALLNLVYAERGP
jgi:acetoin:2,6-dichlorophenolindophenol oxidoreductase subunit alpha